MSITRGKHLSDNLRRGILPCQRLLTIYHPLVIIFLKDNSSDATFSRSSIHIHGQKYADLIN
jgi:hypothetical protein